MPCGAAAAAPWRRRRRAAPRRTSPRSCACSSSVVKRGQLLSRRARSKHCSRPKHEDDGRHVAGVRELAARLDEVLLAELVNERHLALARLDERHRHAARELDPLAELLRVADRGRQDHQLRARIEADDRLLPHVAALGVVEVVALVHHDDVGGRRVLLGDDPVPQDLGDHDLDRRLGVDLVVAGGEADVLVAEVVAQLAVLLLGERAQRRGVDRALAARRAP